MAKIKVDGMAYEIGRQLGNWYDGFEDDVAQIAKEEGKTLLENVKRDSPKKTGEYASGWSMTTKIWLKRIMIKCVNKKKPELTFILEKGHALPSGGRTKAIPHLYKNEEEANRRFMSRVEGLL